MNKNELVTALEIVKPGLASKEVVEQTTSFAFLKNQVVTYNDEICISHPLKDSKIRGAIQAEELYKFLSKAKADELKIEELDGQIILKAGRAKVGFSVQSEIKLPLEEELAEKSKWKDLPADFISAITMAKGSCSKNMAESKLTCVHLNENAFVEASDGNRILHYKLNGKLPMDTVLIPATSITEIAKLNVTKVSKGKGWMHFKNANETVISCRLINETFVDTDAILNVKGKGIKIEFPKELKEILERAEIFAHRKQTTDESIDIAVQKGKVFISAKSDTSWFKENIPVDYSGDDFNFSITPYLLKDIINETTTCNIYKDRLKFKGENWIYIMALRGN